MERLPNKVCRPPRAAISPSMAEKGEQTADVENDPRGGVQSDEYRHADPRDLVQEGDTVMSGPGGAPQEGESVEERRARDRED
jgi:hypothetical protein